MFKRTALIALILAMGLLSNQANAAFVPTDWKKADDKSAVLDESTGIEWLKLNVTHGQSLSEVTERLLSDLVGWRFPTASEVESMMRNSLPNHAYISFGASPAGLVESRSQGKNFTRRNELNHWRTLFGTTSSLQSYGVYLHGDRAYAAGVMTSISTSDYFAVYHTDGGLASMNTVVNNGSSIHGFWLVSDGGATLSSINNPTLNINNPNAPVNQPTKTPADVAVNVSFGLLGLLIMAFGLRRRNSV